MMTTLSMLRKSWEALKHYDMLPATIGYHDRLWSMIITHFGDVPVTEITHDMAVLLRNHLYSRIECKDTASIDRTRAMNTVARRIRDSGSYFRYAQELGMITTNPFALVRCKSSAIPPSCRVLAEEEIARLITKITEPKLKLLVALCYYAGLRRSEASRITMSDINFARNRLTVMPPHGRTSTKHRKRDVLMCGELAEILRKYPQVGEIVGARASASCWPRIRNAAHEAGVGEHELCLQLMRSSRENLWMTQYPPNVVTAWMGHNAQVAASFYRAVPESFYGAKEVSTPTQKLRLCV